MQQHRIQPAGSQPATHRDEDVCRVRGAPRRVAWHVRLTHDGVPASQQRVPPALEGERGKAWPQGAEYTR
jgi:hypothetical protein